MNKSMWNAEAVKAYESGQGVVLVEKPYPHYEPVAIADGGVLNWIADKQFAHEAELYTTPPLRIWVELDEEDYIKAYELCDFDKDAAFEFFEAKLKAKNT
jgi:hypothetical protein